MIFHIRFFMLCEWNVQKHAGFFFEGIIAVYRFTHIFWEDALNFSVEWKSF